MRRCLVPFGVRTLLATDGEVGWRVFRRVLPDLTIIEDMIPRLRGYQLCRELKGTIDGASRPILVMADVRAGGRHRLIASKCDDWIERPFDDAALIAKVRRLLPAAPAFDAARA